MEGEELVVDLAAKPELPRLPAPAVPVEESHFALACAVWTIGVGLAIGATMGPRKAPVPAAVAPAVAISVPPIVLSAPAPAVVPVAQILPAAVPAPSGLDLVSGGTAGDTAMTPVDSLDGPQGAEAARDVLVPLNPTAPQTPARELVSPHLSRGGGSFGSPQRHSAMGRAPQAPCNCGLKAVQTLRTVHTLRSMVSMRAVHSLKAVRWTDAVRWLNGPSYFSSVNSHIRYVDNVSYAPSVRSLDTINRVRVNGLGSGCSGR